MSSGGVRNFEFGGERGGGGVKGPNNCVKIN